MMVQPAPTKPKAACHPASGGQYPRRCRLQTTIFSVRNSLRTLCDVARRFVRARLKGCLRVSPRLPGAPPRSEAIGPREGNRCRSNTPRYRTTAAGRGPAGSNARRSATHRQDPRQTDLRAAPTRESAVRPGSALSSGCCAEFGPPYPTTRAPRRRRSRAPRYRARWDWLALAAIA